MMNSPINTMRGFLVAGAAVAALVAAVIGLWLTVVILVLAVGAHTAYWVHLYRRDGPRQATPPLGTD